MEVVKVRIHHFFLIALILIFVGCDDGGSPPVPPDNPQNPVAVAKADPNPQTIDLPVSFSGSESYDPDGGEIALFEWDWDNDGTFDETGENIEHTWSVSGVYFVQLLVIDNEGVWDLLDDPLQVLISDTSGQNPVAVATADPNPQTINLPVSFSGSDSNDPDGGEIQLFEWDWGNDATYDETGMNVNHTYSISGIYFVQLRVTDDEGVRDLLDDPLQVVISDASGQNPVAIATAGPNPQLVNLPVNFSGSDSYDPDAGTIQLFEWDWENDGIYDDTGENVDHTWSDPGTYHVQLRVTDDESETDTLDEPLEIQITLTIKPVALAEANPNPQLANQPVSFSGSDSYDPDGGDILLYEWDWDNDGIFDESGENVGHSWASGGIYPVQLRVTDDESEIDILNDPLEINIIEPSNLIWARSAGGPFNGIELGYAITTLSDNSIVVTGIFFESATFGAGEPNQTILSSDVGYSASFIARYNPDGTLAWAKRAGGAVYSPDFIVNCSGITALSDNSTVVTGKFYNSATFGPGEPNETVLIASDYSDIFIARYNQDGTLAWAKSAGGAYGDEGHGITTLSDNSAVVTGMFEDSATFGPGEPNQTVLTSAGGQVIFVACFNPADGTLAWAKSAGGASDWADCGYGITTLSDNSTVITGRFLGSATFGLGESSQTILSSGGDTCDIFIARYNPDGTLSWAKRAGGASGYWDCSYGVTALSDNSTVMTGRFDDSATFGPGESNETILTSVGCDDIFIARYYSDGTLAWAKRAGGEINDDMGSAITSLSDNSTVVTGWFLSSATFGPGEPNQTILTAESWSDIFIARYNPDGTLAWAKRAGGAEDFFVLFEVSHGITTLSDDSTVVTGQYWGSATFGPGEPNETVLTSAGGYDIFIARFAP
jgi:uncharacterized delta-60 repeat protein